MVYEQVKSVFDERLSRPREVNCLQFAFSGVIRVVKSEAGP